MVIAGLGPAGREEPRAVGLSAGGEAQRHVVGGRLQRVVQRGQLDRDPAARERLVRVGGKAQVPCLFIDGTPMYESDDIIAHLRRHVAKA